MARTGAVAQDFQADETHVRQALVDEHAELDERLRELDRLVYLTPSEQMERREIQKRKLMAKDRLFGHS
jgi:uncharacterized protein YdcH (DUF465 family)